ncbi:MAG: molybdopterin oxidoreductase, partial [Flavobacteriaceae bacterium]|nr:molybdopterin oxidoreductase [Flavobacteriaceae bacterium]
IIVTSLHRDYLPSSWTMFSPTFVDIGIFIGTVGFFFLLFLLYARTFPVIAQAEVKTILKSSGERYKRLRESGQSLVGSGADPRTSSVAGSAVMEVIKDEPETQELSSEDMSQQTDTLLDKLGSFDPSTQTADDLKKIKGIGPKMEEALNQIGIYTFLQVSKMTKNEYDLLDSITGSFPGRAERDDWAGQAKNFIN